MKDKRFPKLPDSYSTDTKQPRKEVSANDMEHKLVWQFAHLDMNHEKWGWKNLNSSTANLLEWRIFFQN